MKRKSKQESFNDKIKLPKVSSENVKDSNKMTKKNFAMGVFSKNDDFPTPKYFFDDLNKEFHFTFDPCPLHGKDNPKKDGLKIEWGKSNFVNPPYSNIKSWILKALQELLKGKSSVFLITAKTSSSYWHDFIFPFASEIRFLKTGLIFGHHKKVFPFPLAIVIFDPENIPKRKEIEKESYSYALIN